MHDLDLERIVAPLTAQEFIQSHFARRFVYFQGEPGRFAAVFSWHALNSILRHHRLDFPRLRMAKDGILIPTDQFVKYENVHGRSPRVLPIELTACLRGGATLVLDGVEELCESVTVLAERLERVLLAPVNANLYAAWHTVGGFDLHWDDHDVIVIQVAGKKDWEIHGETEKFPVDRYSTAQTPPKAGPIWRGTLQDGDALYIPRGHWHVARPCDEPTMHLTFAITRPATVAMLNWMTEQLKVHECIRRDVPRFEDADAQARHLREVQQLITNAWSDPAILERFLRSQDVASPARPLYGFPWSATAMPDEMDGQIIHVLAPRGLDIRQRPDGTVDVGANGRTYTYPEDTLSLFQYLSGPDRMSVGQFYARFEEEFGKEELRQCLADWMIHGLVILCEPSTARE